MSTKTELELQNKIRNLLGHEQVEVHSSGVHFLIQLIEDGSVETIARITKIAPNLYGAAFRTHKGRWEPLPIEGDALAVAEAVIDMLRPHFAIMKF